MRVIRPYYFSWLCFTEAVIEQDQLTASFDKSLQDTVCQKQFSKGLELSKILQYVQPIYIVNCQLA